MSKFMSYFMTYAPCKLGTYVSANGTKVEKFVTYGGRYPNAFTKVVTLPANSPLRRAGIDHFEWCHDRRLGDQFVRIWDEQGRILAQDSFNHSYWPGVVHKRDKATKVAEFIATIKKRMSSGS